jgi:3-dehydroquinate synthase
MPELFKELESYLALGFYAMIDRRVGEHLPDWVKSSSHVFWLEHPETQKNLDTFGKACSFFLQHGIDRDSTLLAIGGGATTDLAGFVAASLLRGMKWVSIPTTLLAMVDGAIGGKTSVNTPEGKNLLGAFHAPQEVLICDEFLSTLPAEQLESGKGEVIKYGFLSEKMHHLIIKRADLSVIARECALYKKQVVERDFKEQGERMLLNLGHTLGHAFESTLHLSHGRSVILGMNSLFRVYGLMEMEKKLKEMMQALDVSEEVLNLSNYKLNLPKFLDHIRKDKKRVSEKIRLILPLAIGRCQIQEVYTEDLLQRIKDHVDYKA